MLIVKLAHVLFNTFYQIYRCEILQLLSHADSSCSIECGMMKRAWQEKLNSSNKA